LKRHFAHCAPGGCCAAGVRFSMDRRQRLSNHLPQLLGRAE
jgi:hypothetical protein